MDFVDYARQFADAFKIGRENGFAPLSGLEQPVVEDDAPVAVICSPHPDDEVIVGALPLRLRLEAGWRVINLAITLGSNQARQAARKEELSDACQMMAFDCQVIGGKGLERIRLDTRREDPVYWTQSVGLLGHTLQVIRPRMIIFPHAYDRHPTHIGVNGLVRQALIRMGKDFSCDCVQTEFWGAMEHPNLLVESSVDDVGRMMAALACHRGEVERNPYHLRLPAWLSDNVRRGGEILDGMGGQVPDFVFGTLYRSLFWNGQKLINRFGGGRTLPIDENPGTVFSSFPPEIAG